MGAACRRSGGFGWIFILWLVGCGGSHGSAPGAADSKTAARDAPQVDHIAQVDVSSLTDAEKALWVDLINDQLSPCGDPISVGRCATEQRTCGSCVTAARYLARLVMEGYDRAALIEQYRVRFGSPSGPGQAQATAKDERPSLAALAVDESPSRGAPMARVTIVEFSDFQCPHCGAAHPELVRLLHELEGKVRLVYKYFPLSSHTRAVPAARAAEAARGQGKFWEMHDALFEHQGALEDSDIRKYATQLGLDMDRFERDWSAEATAQRVDADRQLGQRLGIEATPSFFVDGRPFRESPRSLAAYVKEQLEL